MDVISGGHRLSDSRSVRAAVSSILISGSSGVMVSDNVLLLLLLLSCSDLQGESLAEKAVEDDEDEDDEEEGREL